MQKQYVSEWFHFSKKTRNGTLLLLVLILLFIIIRVISPLFIKQRQYDHSEFEKEIAALKIKRADSVNKYRNRYDDNDDVYQPYSQPYENKNRRAQEWKGTLFYFDPNTLDAAGWQKLGVRDKTIGTIQNYLSKGGKFSKAEDIKKIWGLTEELADKLIPYIRIERQEYAATGKPVYEKKIYTPAAVDVNSADTTAFIALPGIGSKLAQRIVNFRDRLGGFHTIEQVGETFGLQDSTFQKIKSRFVLNNPSVKKLNINMATVDELKMHPYIRYTIGNAIVQYRTQHGSFRSVNDLKKIVLITEDVYNKLQPYIKTE